MRHRCLWFSFNLREFVKTSVILTPGALLVGCEPQFVLHFRGIEWIRGGAQKLIFEQYKSVLARSSVSKRQKKQSILHLFWTRFFFFHFCNKDRYSRSRRTRNDRKTKCILSCFVKNNENRCTIVQNQWKSMKTVVLSCFLSEIDENCCVVVFFLRNSLDCCSKSFKIDENRCTVMFFLRNPPSALPPVRPPVRPSARPSVRPGRGQPNHGRTYIHKLPIDRHGRLLLVIQN